MDQRASRRVVLAMLTAGLVSTKHGTLLASAPLLRFSTAFGPPVFNDDGSGYFNRIIGEACKRLGYEVEVDAPPAERALVNANAGLVDGDGPRVENLGEIGFYPNLLRVPIELIEIDFVAFKRGLPVEGSGWAMLAPYNVGIVRGWKILEQHIVGTRSLFRAKTASQLFNLLANDRIDVAVIDRLSGLEAARKIGIADVVVKEPPLGRQPMYLHLHKRLSALVEPLATVLAEMKSDGTFARIEIETLGSYLSAGKRAGELP